MFWLALLVVGTAVLVIWLVNRPGRQPTQQEAEDAAFARRIAHLPPTEQSRLWMRRINREEWE
jgi:hypothetical protein